MAKKGAIAKKGTIAKKGAIAKKGVIVKIICLHSKIVLLVFFLCQLFKLQTLLYLLIILSNLIL